MKTLSKLLWALPLLCFLHQSAFAILPDAEPPPKPAVEKPRPKPKPAPRRTSLAELGGSESRSGGLYETAFNLWKEGDYATAEVAFERLLAKNPKHAKGNFYYANILIRKGDEDTALEHLQVAAQGDSEESFKAQVKLDELEKKVSEARRQAAEAQAAAAAKRQAEEDARAAARPYLAKLQANMVVLPNKLKMGKYEVTQGLWLAVMGNNPSYFSSCGLDCPVDQVSWNDVQEFLQRLNQQTGQRFRLPTEEEWYAACQAGRSTEYCGSDNIDSVAWYVSNSGVHAHPVGQKSPNAWGLYDMTGNVWEWTSSCWEGDCARRVHRGCSWNCEPVYVRSASRGAFGPTYRYNILGFRLAQD